MLSMAVVAGISLAWLSYTRSVGPACLALIVLGASIMLFMGMANTLIQTNTSAALRGRVMSIYTMTVLGFMPLGSGLLGWAASLSSLPSTFAVAGAIVVMASLFAAWRSNVRVLG